jgi:hypothetical protein
MCKVFFRIAGYNKHCPVCATGKQAKERKA